MWCSSSSKRTRTGTDPPARPEARAEFLCQLKKMRSIEPPRLPDGSASAQTRRGRGPRGVGLDVFASRCDLQFVAEPQSYLAPERKDRRGAPVGSDPFGSDPKLDEHMELRAMRADDWPAVKAIYEQGIATRQATFETEAPAWEAWDAGHLAEPRL